MARPLSSIAFERAAAAVSHRADSASTHWKNWFAKEAQYLKDILPEEAAIHPIGSAVIPGIWAKSIIDILALLPAALSYEEIKVQLQPRQIIPTDMPSTSTKKGFVYE